MTPTTAVFREHTFELHPYGAAFWKDRSMLLVADVHLGKTAHFRKNGMAVPEQAMYKAYEKLDELCAHYEPETLCFLGDLFHSYINNEWKLFQSWVRTAKTNLVLITGNHDIIPEHKLEKLNIEIKDEWELEEFLLTHEPTDHPELFNLCGHIHPGIRLKGPAKQTLKLPCFFQKEHQLILPAFGEFTGKYVMTPTKEDKVFAVTPEEVLLVSGE
ncbi:ligase-associated DNA damage response endonuclease PdeM [Robertkochia marina]|uniref:Ligase-associated DNA damage response endonuclease PdeM n=1 Tax=Robertkochia marina TaxID=1227945 RepID=A0A4S3M430_9FLAO|nr:ligase-associated DNA damage response endonuclease PdeM [Robertkochia marina]THD69061.1 ligase-associated DNA damage response endonuclease PdeM [Robertkochia marina]TRZ44885.1 ligase-associated DNA damage response endonuclease PdeM [Robertkochia marina]